MIGDYDEHGASWDWHAATELMDEMGVADGGEGLWRWTFELLLPPTGSGAEIASKAAVVMAMRLATRSAQIKVRARYLLLQCRVFSGIPRPRWILRNVLEQILFC